MEASYLSLSEKEWRERVEAARELLAPCRVCPRECLVDRTDPEAPGGFCRMKEEPVISSAHPHHWEERCISGAKGSGIIFFTSCNLACVFCQNFEISQLRIGHPVSVEELAQTMLGLQVQGCHNINLCSPSIWVPQILEALHLAAKGLAKEKRPADSPKPGFGTDLKAWLFSSAGPLDIPIVYNTGGYDRVETLKLLDGIVDVYMPDIKYSNNEMGQKYSGAPDYWDVARKAVKEMHRQVGDLVIDKNGIARRGLLIRHLVLPNNIAGTGKVMEFLAEKISKDTYVNIMDQYRPAHKAQNYPKLSRGVTIEEFEKAVRLARDAGLHRFDHTA